MRSALLFAVSPALVFGFKTDRRDISSLSLFSSPSLKIQDEGAFEAASFLNRLRGIPLGMPAGAVSPQQQQMRGAEQQRMLLGDMYGRLRERAPMPVPAKPMAVGHAPLRAAPRVLPRAQVAQLARPLTPAARLIRPAAPAPPMGVPAAQLVRPGAPLARMERPLGAGLGPRPQPRPLPGEARLLRMQAPAPMQAQGVLGKGALLRTATVLPPRAAAAAPAAAAPAAGAGSRLPEAPAELPAEQREQILKQIKQEVVQVMKRNVDAKARDKEVAGTAGRHPVEDVAHAALVKISGGGAADEIILTNITDPITGTVLLPQCSVKELRVLGVGGMGMVLAVGIVGDADAAVLGSKELAMKLMYEQLAEEPSTVPSAASLPPQLLRSVADGLEELFRQELDPLHTVAAAAQATKGTTGQAAVSSKAISSSNHWALPLYQASLGTGGSAVHVHGGFAFLGKVLLSEIMLGDAALLIYGSTSGIPVARLGIPAKEYVCGELIAATAKLHDAGMCHWDIKPENMLIADNGDVYLADFGMSSKTNEKRSCEEKLTPMYMEPSHAACAIKHGSVNLDPRYDAWSVGLSCYILLTDAKLLPYGMSTARHVTPFLANLDPKTNPRAPPFLKNPEDELKEHGVSPFWASLVGSLLNRDRTARPIPQEIIAKYPHFPLESSE
ncbi:Rhoptry kinase family protein ROP25, putative [Eimeria necatrix]|uniref:mitogen-activated protein kinase kinase n=1 Tax=Eimeria necatrix TaxID=51315 RepID=U6MJ41_9EIME|nr:Rhoptry kinase family protein ROP25, putative [Eimeria necatrix]CDJ64262.1 Rhoptry kinase family protein ROP25, putative [Eimeria necatrix]